VHVNLRSNEMPNHDINLTVHEKRGLAWKILIVTAIMIIAMVSAGLLHAALAITDQALSVWMLGIAFIAIAMFAVGYITRDRMPKKMEARCRRFYFFGREFGIWHWTRAQIFLADIFLVAFGGAIYGWSASHSFPLIAAGIHEFDVVPLLYIPVFFVPFWTEFIMELLFLIMTVIGFFYEIKTWIVSKKNDFCFFEGLNSKSTGTTYDCNPGDPGCHFRGSM